MKKWEEKYEYYKNGGIDNEITKLRDEMNAKANEAYENEKGDDIKKGAAKGRILKEYNKEIDKLGKIRTKMPQVENIMQYRNKLQNELNVLNNEIKAREALQQANKKKEELEVELTGLKEEAGKIDEKLKNAKSDKEKNELQAKKLEITNKINNNHKAYSEQEQILRNGLNEKRENAELSKSDIEKRKFEISTKMSKCNLVAKNLLNGLSWESIDLKLDNWKDRKFTQKDDKDNQKNEKAEEEKADEFVEEYNPDFSDYEIESEENKPDLTFADKHPRLAKIGNFFKNIKDKIVNGTKKVFRKEKEDQQEEIEGEKQEQQAQEEAKTFKEYIRQVAEKGIDGIEAEEKLAREQAAKERLAKMKLESRAKEAEKFGEDYAKKSDDLRGIEDEGR